MCVCDTPPCNKVGVLPIRIVKSNVSSVGPSSERNEGPTLEITGVRPHSPASIIFRLIVIVVVYLYFIINSYFKHV